MSDRTESHAFDKTFDYAEMVPQHYGNALAMMSQTYSGYIEGAAMFNQELSAFMRNRLDKDRNYGQALSSTQGLEDAASLHQDWVRTAANDYFSETTRLFNICFDAASNARTNSGSTALVKTETVKSETTKSETIAGRIKPTDETVAVSRPSPAPLTEKTTRTRQAETPAVA